MKIDYFDSLTFGEVKWLSIDESSVARCNVSFCMLRLNMSRTWDSKYVREKYRVNMAFQSGIFYPCTNPKRLLVFFSTMGKDRFDRYSWYWREDEDWDGTAYLFLKDDSFRYFLGAEGKPTVQAFRNIINYHREILGLEYNQVTAIGTSMGGYAAIFYASYLQFDAAIVASPQIDYSSARKAHAVWERYIREAGPNWYDLDDFILRQPRIPKIYIEYGNYIPDRLAAKKLFDAVRLAPNSLIISRKALWDGHTGNPELSKQTIESVLEFFSQQSL